MSPSEACEPACEQRRAREGCGGFLCSLQDVSQDLESCVRLPATHSCCLGKYGAANKWTPLYGLTVPRNDLSAIKSCSCIGLIARKEANWVTERKGQEEESI